MRTNRVPLNELRKRADDLCATLRLGPCPLTAEHVDWLRKDWNEWHDEPLLPQDVRQIIEDRVQLAESYIARYSLN